MIRITTIEELKKYCDDIRAIKGSNYQQSYENIYSIHLSNDKAITFLSNGNVSTFIPKNENVLEFYLNIDPIYVNSKSYLNFINEIFTLEKKSLYFPLVYEDSNFYKLYLKDFYSYKRLYTSICEFNKVEDIMSITRKSKTVKFTNRHIKIFEKNLYVKKLQKCDVKEIIKEIEKNSWKYEKKQDMITKEQQLIYYNELIKQGIAEIAVAYSKDEDKPIAYRIDAIYNNRIHVLKNSYNKEYKKYSPGTYLLIYDLYNSYRNYDYIDLYGGPGLAKQMIETRIINRYDMFYGNKKYLEPIKSNRIHWDDRNYNNFIEKKSIKEVFNKKINVLAVTSCFGLGPVGKLNAIIEEGLEQYNWYAGAEEFDINIFTNNIFKDCCFSMNEIDLKEFINKYNIKYAVVVLKNKVARLLKKLNVKVVYVDSLPFMWSKKDAEEGKVPYHVDRYCAQKTIDLSKESKKIFDKVENLVWVNPIVNNKIQTIPTNKIHQKNILINLGGLHSPTTDGIDYVELVIKPIVKHWSNKRITITTSTSSRLVLEKYFEEYKNVHVKTYTQYDFMKQIKRSNIFLSSPGLTTILESSGIREDIIFLPPQNISQFYNIEFGKKVFLKYKEITWNDKKLSLEGLKKVLDGDEKEIIDEINKRIKNKKKIAKYYEEYIKQILMAEYKEQKLKAKIKLTGAEEVIEQLNQIIKEDNNENILS